MGQVTRQQQQGSQRSNSAAASTAEIKQNSCDARAAAGSRAVERAAARAAGFSDPCAADTAGLPGVGTGLGG